MNKQCTVTGILFVALCLTIGCAETQISNRQVLVSKQLPRPVTIWVHDFAATPADIPPESALAGAVPQGGTTQTPQHIAEGRKLGAAIEQELVAEINAMGMQAVHAVQGTMPQINDLVIKGYIISYTQGDEAARVGLGFGAGNTDLKVAVEGFQMTHNGLRKLGSADTDAEGSKKPGGALGLAVLLATHNPAGLIVSSGMSIYGEESGSDKVVGRAKQTAREIADQLKIRFQAEGWIN